MNNSIIRTEIGIGSIRELAAVDYQYGKSTNLPVVQGTYFKCIISNDTTGTLVPGTVHAETPYGRCVLCRDQYLVNSVSLRYRCATIYCQ